MRCRIQDELFLSFLLMLSACGAPFTVSGRDAGKHGDAATSENDAGLDDAERGDETDASASDDAAPDACEPKSCITVGWQCGVGADGCGGTFMCGCMRGLICDAVHQCICKPKTCAETGTSCGAIGDGCGGKLSCGCANGAACSNGSCCIAEPQQTTCSGHCGAMVNNCGQTVDCSTCTPPNWCGGSGTPGVCGGCSAVSMGLSCGKQNTQWQCAAPSPNPGSCHTASIGTANTYCCQ